VIARIGVRRVHSIVPDQREWLSVLVCINVVGIAIPSFYIFREKGLDRTTLNDVKQVQLWQCSQGRG
jgi:hypothetical protein